MTELESEVERVEDMVTSIQTELSRCQGNQQENLRQQLASFYSCVLYIYIPYALLSVCVCLEAAQGKIGAHETNETAVCSGTSADELNWT